MSRFFPGFGRASCRAGVDCEAINWNIMLRNRTGALIKCIFGHSSTQDFRRLSLQMDRINDRPEWMGSIAYMGE